MKNKHFLAMLAIPLAIAVIFSGPIACSNPKLRINELTDEKCPYERGECPNPHCSNFPPSRNVRNAVQFVPAGDYQLELIEDSILVWHGERYVGTLPLWDKSPLDLLITKDNE